MRSCSQPRGDSIAHAGHQRTRWSLRNNGAIDHLDRLVHRIDPEFLKDTILVRENRYRTARRSGSRRRRDDHQWQSLDRCDGACGVDCPTASDPQDDVTRTKVSNRCKAVYLRSGADPRELFVDEDGPRPLKCLLHQASHAHHGLLFGHDKELVAQPRTIFVKPANLPRALNVPIRCSYDLRHRRPPAAEALAWLHGKLFLSLFYALGIPTQPCRTILEIRIRCASARPFRRQHGQTCQSTIDSTECGADSPRDCGHDGIV